MKMRKIEFLLIAGLSLSGCTETIQQRMIAELEEADTTFDASSKYKEYLQHHGEDAQKLREAAAQAATIRIRIHVYHYQGSIEETISLTEEEVKAVKEIMAEIQQTPPHSFDKWLEVEHFSQFVQMSVSQCWSVMEFVSAEDTVLHTFQFNQMIGSTSREEAYKVGRELKPHYMLPDAALERWDSLNFINRAANRLNQLRDETE